MNMNQLFVATIGLLIITSLLVKLGINILDEGDVGLGYSLLTVAAVCGIGIMCVFFKIFSIL